MGKPMLHRGEYVLTPEQVRRLGFMWNGPLEVSPTGGYRPAPCTTAGSIYHDLDDVIREFAPEALDDDDA